MSRERRPDPPPLETNDVAIVAGGTVLWAVACVVLIAARLAGADVMTWWITMCAAGALLGLVGVRYCARRRNAIARNAIARDAGA
jgi:fatty acid desaturase